jgi:hypothetical protein
VWRRLELIDMRLIKLSKFRALICAPGGGPTVRTLRKQIHQIPGGRVELGRYWVDLDEYDRVHDLRGQLARREKELAEDPRVAGLL